MTLRSHLLRLTLLVLFPLAIFGVAATLWIAERERDAFEQGARQRTLALLTAVDTELQGHALRLRVLASSYNLQAGDLPAFQREISRALAQQAGWRNVILTSPAGQLLLSASAPDAPSAAVVPPPAAAGADEPASNSSLSVNSWVGNLADHNGEQLFSMQQSVQVGGHDAVLTALILPSSILNLLTPQRLPANWVGVVLDANQNIVARTLDHAAMLGRPASESLRQALDRSEEGWFHGRTIEGFDVYTPYNRSSRSGWAVAVGIPAAHVENTMNTSGLFLVVGLLTAVIVAMLLAGLYSNHIAAPIVSLAAAAKALGTGDAVRPLQSSRFREVREVSHALVTSADIIREREEKLHAADQAKDEFLAMLGHELRNPLGAMAAASQVLALGTSDPNLARDAADVITRQVARMTRLVDDLLNVGRVVSGKVSLRLRPMDLAKSAAQVVDNLRQASAFDRLELETDLSETWVNGDEARIEQILFNLLENAAKYTPPGGRITVRVYAAEGAAVFEVTDTGIGLDAELLPRVFDLFSQGERSMDRGVSGLGIGLTLVKQLTEMHSGRVSAVSAGAGLGAQFTVRFPAIAPQAEATRSVPGPVSVEEDRSVLLIEDNDDGRRSMAAALAHYGYQVFEAADGTAGIETAVQVCPDCAVIDIGLPHLDGYEVASRLRASPACGTALLIALTGYGGDAARARAIAAGFDDYLVKPVSPTALVELIESRIQPAGGGRSR